MLLCCHIALLFTAILAHGSLPVRFLYSTIIPIPKNRNANTCDSANYRGIAVSSTILCCITFLNHSQQMSCSLVLKQRILPISVHLF